jgi:hypothetical protein
MRYFVAALAIVVMLAGSSLAGYNPDCKVFVTFDGAAADYQDIEDGARTDPTPYTLVTGYVGLCDYANWTTISLLMAVDPGVSLSTNYASLLPGGLTIGTWDTGNGITLTSTSAITPGVYGPFHFFATVSLVVTGTAGEVKVLDHGEYPRWVADSVVGNVDYYCVWQNAGVYVDPVVVEAECAGNVPVESSTWGGIKALYR